MGTDIKQDIEYRFHNLLIGNSYAKQAAGKAPENDEENNVTNDPNRKLLQVEKATKRNKDLQKKSIESYRATTRDALHKALEEKMVEEMNDFDNFFL